MKTEISRKENIINWGKERDLISYDNRFIQLAKAIEELGELAKAMIKQDEAGIKDGLGDCRITLTILSEQLGYDIDECEELAYNVIKDRQGKKVNGSFIKNEDL